MNHDENLDIRGLGERLISGGTTVTEIVEQTIARTDASDDSLGAYITRFDDSARAQAAELDRELRAGRSRGPLHGIPLAVKDMFTTPEGPTTAQSRARASSWSAREDGAAIDRLRRAGMVVMGKTTMMELATGIPTPEDGFPVPRNPWDPQRWPGGSSSGSAIAVAAGMAPAALGTDTGGSIRCPAALCGVTGFKPSFGLVPKSGCIPVGLTYDHAGPIAGTAEDCAILTEAMAGWDPSDHQSTRDHQPAAGALLGRDLRGVRVGVLKEAYEGSAQISADVTEAMNDAMRILRDAGATVQVVSIPYWEELGDATMLGSLCEHYANFAEELREQWSSIGRAARASLAVGALVSSRDYVQAQRIRAYAVEQLAILWNSVDHIASPTIPRGAFLLEDSAEIAEFPALTAPWNSVGVPALSVPMRADAHGLPLGLQLAGPFGRDAQVLAAGHAFQQLTSWHRGRPAETTHTASRSTP